MPERSDQSRVPDSSRDLRPVTCPRCGAVERLRHVAYKIRTGVTTVGDGRRGDLPFWDEAGPNQPCMVPCLPTDADQNADDCLEEEALVGMMGVDGVFLNAKWRFRPACAMWHCGRHLGPRLMYGAPGDGEGWRPRCPEITGYRCGASGCGQWVEAPKEATRGRHETKGDREDGNP